MLIASALALEPELRQYHPLRNGWQTPIPDSETFWEYGPGSHLGFLLLALRTHNFKADNQRRLPVCFFPDESPQICTWPKVLDRFRESLPLDNPPETPGEIRGRVNDLTGILAVGVPMASAILHFRYPDHCPIIDYRVLRSLRDQANNLGIGDNPVPVQWEPRESEITAEMYAGATMALRGLRDALNADGEQQWSLRDVERALRQFDVWRERTNNSDEPLMLREP